MIAEREPVLSTKHIAILDFTEKEYVQLVRLHRIPVRLRELIRNREIKKRGWRVLGDSSNEKFFPSIEHIIKGSSRNGEFVRYSPVRYYCRPINAHPYINSWSFSSVMKFSPDDELFVGLDRCPRNVSYIWHRDPCSLILHELFLNGRKLLGPVSSCLPSGYTKNLSLVRHLSPLLVSNRGVPSDCGESEGLKQDSETYKPLLFCLGAFLLLFFGLWNFQLGPYHWWGLVAILCGIGGLIYGFSLFFESAPNTLQVGVKIIEYFL